jgi:F-box and WD-40 domain protein 1/11
MNSLAQSPNLWSELLLNTPGPKLSEEYKTRATTMTAPGSWTASGVWTPKETSDEIHFPTLYQSRRLLDRVVRGRPLRGLPHVDTLHFSAPIYCVYAWGPWLILGGKDKAIQVWRTSTGNNELIESVPNAHDGSVLALAVDANAEGAKMVTGSSDGTARIWDIAWGREDVGISEVEGEPGSGWKVEVERKGTLTGHTAPVLDVALAKDFIITCSKDTTIRIYHRSTYALCRAIVGLHSGPVNCLALHPDPNIPEFISASGDGSWVRGPIEFPTFFARCQSVNSTIEGGQALACVGWGGPLVVTGSKDARLHAQDITGDGLFTMTRHTDSVRAVDLDVDESGAGTIVSASYDKTVVLWDACTGHERYVFEPHTSIILDVHLTNGRLITYVMLFLSLANSSSASHDQTVQIRTFGTDLPYRDLFV